MPLSHDWKHNNASQKLEAAMHTPYCMGHPTYKNKSEKITIILLIVILLIVIIINNNKIIIAEKKHKL